MHELISRHEAHAKGLKHFYTGVPCKRGHDAERFVANGNCTRCQVFSTPNKGKGPRGRNVGWPAMGLIFTTPDVQSEEMEAAFRMIEANGWHDHCVREMRKDPTLLDKHRVPVDPREVGKLQAQLDRAMRGGFTPTQDVLLTLACGFGQLHYGAPKRVGDVVRCKDCHTDQAVVKIEN